MNKEYTYVEGKVIVIDNFGGLTQRENCDHIEEILMLENLIETIESQIDLLKEKMVLNQKNQKKPYVPTLLLKSLLIGITMAIAVYWIRIEPIKYLVFISYLLSVPVACLDEFRRWKEKRSLNDFLLEDKIKFEFLQERLIKEKKHLEELTKEKKASVVLKMTRVNDKKRLNQLKDELEKCSMFMHNRENREEQRFKVYEKRKKY